jgi:hypothetical protein
MTVDAPHPRVRDLDVVVALEVHGDLRRPEVAVLAQVDQRADDLGPGGLGAELRAARPVPKAVDALMPPEAPEKQSRQATQGIAAGADDVAGDLLSVLQDRQPTSGWTTDCS